MVKKYTPSSYNPTEPLAIRTATSMAQASSVLNRLTEAAAGRHYVVAEQYALELLRTAELAVQYYQQFTRPGTILSLPGPLGKKVGDWDPNDSTNHLFPPSTYEAGSYYVSIGCYADFEPGDLLIAIGEDWYRLPAEYAADPRVDPNPDDLVP